MTDSSALTKAQPESVYSSIQSFESAQRMAKSLAESDIVPPLYRGKLGNCIVAIEIANRMSMSTIQVMQNLNLIHGQPSWKSQFIIGLILGCGRFESFDYDETPDSCQCFAVSKATGKQVSGLRITLETAKAEGWTRNSKWRTMPETMLRYRAASSFGRFHIPDLILGIQSVEENEVIDAEIAVVPDQPELKLDQINDMLAPKTEPEPVPDPQPTPLVERDDFFD